MKLNVRGRKKNLEKLRKKLRDLLGENIISVELIDGWDGSNVRIVVKEASMEVVRKVVEAIKEVEEEIGEPGTFIPDVVEEHEL